MENSMKLRNFALPVLITFLLILNFSILVDRSLAYDKIIPDFQSDSLVVGDFFLTEDEYPPGITNDSGIYDPAAYIRVRGLLMGSQWWSVRPRDSSTNIVFHVHIGLFPTEAEAIKYSDPDTFIFQTDAYAETGLTINELMQTQPAYTVTGGTIYGDGGFSGGYQHQKFQPFNVFRVGRVIFHTDASEPAGEGILEPLLVEKARRLQNMEQPPEEAPPADIGSDLPSGPTDTPKPQGPPFVLKASLDGKGETTLTLPNNDNYGVIIIEGRVVDKDGNGMAGANVEVVSGADPASITTNTDGTYSLVISVPGGEGNGYYTGVTFTLELIDLSVREVVLLQAIDGGQIVQDRDIGVRVFLNWTGKTPIEVEVIATVDGTPCPSVQGVAKSEYTQRDINIAKDSINLVLPKDLFPFNSSSTHSIVVMAQILDSNMQDIDLENNTSAAQTFTLQRTDSPSLLYVSMAPSIGRAELVRFSGQANRFVEQVYPIPFAWAMVGTARVSHYIVDPNTEFLKSQSTDNWPNWVPEFVKSGADIPLQALKSGTYISSIRTVEKARLRYNAQRCRDASGKFILPCDEPRATHAVGVYPNDAYGSEKAGFAYQIFRNRWRAMLNDITYPKNVAHELGHLYGLSDEYGSGATGKPIQGYSWDGQRFLTETGSSINFMGQVHLAPPWVDNQTWNQLIGTLKMRAFPEAVKIASTSSWAPQMEILPFTEVEAPALIVEGVIGQDGFALIESVTPIYKYEQPVDSGGPYTLQALDDQGQVLAETQFDGLFSDQYDPTSPVVPFLEVLPVSDPQQVSEVTIQQSEGAVTASLERSSAAPTASFDPLPAVSDDPLTLSWHASDADGDTLLSTLFYSANGGQRWQVLGTDLPVTNLTIDPNELPGGEGLFWLVVSDGMNEVEVLSDPILLPDHPPVVVILDDGQTSFESDAPVTLTGFGYDIEDGTLTGDSLTWVDGSGQIIGSGNNLQAETAAGETTVILQASDSTGQVGSASIDISVVGESPMAADSSIAIDPLSGFYLLGGCACVSLAAGGFLLGGAFLIVRRRRAARFKSTGAQSQAVQDQQGTWWYQDSQSGVWNFWNGRAWQPMPAVQNQIARPPSIPRSKYRSSGSCLLTLVVGGLIGAIIFGGVSLIAFNFFPPYAITLGQGDVKQILIKGGGGLLVTLLGLLLLNGGFHAVLTRRAFVEDEWGRQREKRGCSAILNGLGQLFFGLLCLTGGLGLIALTIYQEVLPWLGF